LRQEAVTWVRLHTCIHMCSVWNHCDHGLAVDLAQLPGGSLWHGHVFQKQVPHVKPLRRSGHVFGIRNGKRGHAGCPAQSRVQMRQACTLYASLWAYTLAVQVLEAVCCMHGHHASSFGGCSS
jgi:hypothetical protein